jgi:hypothetical protein
MADVRQMWVREPIDFLISVADFCSAAERCRRGERDAVIPVIRQAVDDLHRAGRPFFGVLGIQALVDTLVNGGDDDDLAEAERAIDLLVSWQGDSGSAVVNVTELRLRALLAGARDDGVAYRALAERYRAMAESLGFDGHIAWARSMTEADLV